MRRRSISLSLTHEEWELLQLWAEQHKCSKGDYIRYELFHPGSPPYPKPESKANLDLRSRVENLEEALNWYESRLSAAERALHEIVRTEGTP